MNETYLIMAKTVEEAIAIANREYAKNGKEVSYEILEMPKKGIFGIGARDAKIKITVSESESAKIGSELSSLVADLRSMKVQTNRGGSGESEEKPKKPAQAQGQKKPQNGQQNAQKPAQGQKSQNAPKSANAQKPAAQGQKTEGKPGEAKPEAAKQPKPAQKPQTSEAKPKTEQKPVQKPAEAKSAEPKQDKPQKPQEPKKPVEKPMEAKPAEAKKHQEPKPQKPAPVKETKEKEPVVEAKPVEPKREPKPEKTEKSEPKKPQTPPIPQRTGLKTVVSEAIAGPVMAPAAAIEPVKEPEVIEPAKEYKSNLRNQAKPQRRQKPPKADTVENVPGAEAIISAPMGLTDFTREENGESFGNSTASSGRMSNDIRKKSRHSRRGGQAEAPAAKTEEKPAVDKMRVDVDALVEAALAPADVAEEFVRESDPALETAVSEALDALVGESVEVPAEEERQKVGVTEAEMVYALDFLNTLLKNMAIGATADRVECPEGEEYVIEGDANVYPKINIDGDGTGILIGHHGETLDAVQYLVNLAALRQSKQKGGDYVKIVVDIENYRAKREETLRSLARRMAARAVKYKRNVFLEPMNAYERRIIHSELHSFENVSTHSVGADKNRKIIITYEGPDKAPQPPRREREERAEGGNKESKGSGNRRERRPRKTQKMPIEKLPEILPESPVVTEEAPAETEE